MQNDFAKFCSPRAAWAVTLQLLVDMVERLAQWLMLTWQFGTVHWDLAWKKQGHAMQFFSDSTCSSAVGNQSSLTQTVVKTPLHSSILSIKSDIFPNVWFKPRRAGDI